MKMKFFFFLLTLFLYQVNSFESVCKKLQISSDIQVTKDDVVSNGLPSEKWNSKTMNPVITPSSIMIDYLYVTVEGNHKSLDINSFKFDFDDHFFANSSISLTQREVQKNGGQYTIEIKYKCKEYGGALIDYQLSISVGDCGVSHLFWKKICGNPLTTRDGLSLDVEFKQYNQTIIKDGQLVNASYFDDDIDNYVFLIPANQDETKFFLHLDLPQQDQNEKSEFIKSLEKYDIISEEDGQNDDMVENDLNQLMQDDVDNEIDNLEILDAILKLVPEVQISTPIVDADTSILKPVISGQLQNGGIVNDQPQSLILAYNCLQEVDLFVLLKSKKGETTIELVFPLDYFKDINLVFVKRCFIDDDGKILKENKKSWFMWFLILIFMLEVLGTTYNILKLKKNGLDAIPLANLIIKFISKIKFIQKLLNGQDSNRNNNRSKRFPYQSMDDEEFEQEFKIQNISVKEKYGSI